MAQPFTEPCSRGVIISQPCPRELGCEIPLRARRLVLAGCVLASSMAFIDGSVLTIALPRLQAALGADLASLQWVLNGYLLAFASLTLIGGAMADAQGKARILSLGCVLFAAASIACGLAQSAAWLIVARVVQGIGGALVAPASLALIGAVFPKSERNAAVGVWAAASSLTTAAGPVLGGWLTETFGWHAVFWINPPIAAAALALILGFAPADRREPRGFDFVGAGIIAAALAAIAWALSQIGRAETSSADMRTALGVALVGVFGLVAYVVWERISDHPMTPPRIGKNRAFVGLNVATLLVYDALAIMFFLLPFELVDRRGLPSAEAGLAMLPFTLPIGLLSQPFGKLADATGPRPLLVIGPLGAAAGYVWLALGRDASLVAGVLAPMALLGLSFALVVAPLTASVMSSVAQADEGLASGVNNAAARIAQLVGIAMAAGFGTHPSGYGVGMIAAAVLSVAGALTVALVVPSGAARASSGASG
jgi:EmrB/QacA subfamily drug resistance transporter